MKDFDYDLFITRLFAKSKKSGVPLGGTFELTSRCTLSCKMCYIHSAECEKSEKSTKWWLNIAQQAKESGTLILLLTGGEPLLRKDFEEIYLACLKMGFLISINTNATLIDSEKVRFFAENPPQRLNITLYGASSETYGSLCGNAAGFEKTVAAIKGLKEAGVPVKLNFSMTALNAHDAEAVQALAKEWGLPIQPVSYMFSSAQSCSESVYLSPEEAAKEHFLWQKRLLGEKELAKYIDFNFHKKPVTLPDNKINCRAGSTTFWITADGKMLPCGMFKEPCVPVETFGEAWECIRREREKIYLPSACANCKRKNICDICAAVSYSETGKFDGLPSYACQKAIEYTKLCDGFIESLQGGESDK